MTALPCSSSGCDRAAVVAMRLRGHAGHVHDCALHAADLRRAAAIEVVAEVPLAPGDPCPWPCTEKPIHETNPVTGGTEAVVYLDEDGNLIRKTADGEVGRLPSFADLREQNLQAFKDELDQPVVSSSGVRYFSVDPLPWAPVWPWLRCRARREPRPDLTRDQHFGRCDLRAGHDGDHALERGFDTPRWSTDWTDVAPAQVPPPAEPEVFGVCRHPKAGTRCTVRGCNHGPGCC